MEGLKSHSGNPGGWHRYDIEILIGVRMGFLIFGFARLIGIGHGGNRITSNTSRIQLIQLGLTFAPIDLLRMNPGHSR